MRILVLLLAACGPTVTFTPGEDTSSRAPDTDPPQAPPSACDKDILVPLDGFPAPTFQFPVAWQVDRAEVTAEGFGLNRTLISPDEETGCLHFDPGQLRIDLLGTGCAASSVSVELIAGCPANGCVEVSTFAGDTPTGSTRSVSGGTREVVELTPTQPFTVLTVGATDVQVCTVQFKGAPLPDELRTEETGDLF